MAGFQPHWGHEQLFRLVSRHGAHGQSHGANSLGEEPIAKVVCLVGPMTLRLGSGTPKSAGMAL